MEIRYGDIYVCPECGVCFARRQSWWGPATKIDEMKIESTQRNGARLGTVTYSALGRFKPNEQQINEVLEYQDRYLQVAQIPV
jgi:hypothetical protein